MKITLVPAILPAEVALSVFGDCAYASLAAFQPARHAWLMTLPPPLLLKLWILQTEVELERASPDKRTRVEGNLFSCGALGGEGRSTQGFAAPLL